MIARREIAPPPDLLERHRRFWNHEAADPPLVRVDTDPGRIELPPVQEVYGASAGEPIGPDQADVDRYLACIRWQRVVPPGEADLFDVLPAYLRIPWLEAIAGCKVVPHPNSDSIWSREPDVPLREPRSIQPNLAWLDALVRQVERLSEDDALPCPTAQTLLRGPGDVAEALLGAEALCMAIGYEADWLEDFLAASTELFIRAARVQLTRIRPYWGGHFSLPSASGRPSRACGFKKMCRPFSPHRSTVGGCDPAWLGSWRSFRTACFTFIPDHCGWWMRSLASPA